MPTTDQWRDTLEKVLAERQAPVELYKRYYRGDHGLQFATTKFREAFGTLFQEFADNWCALVVDGAVERLSILGFRFGEDDADAEAWRIWQANGLDAQAIQGHTEAVKTGWAYLLVGPPNTPGGEPVISVESPTQCIVAVDPADSRNRLAGFKTYRDTDGTHVSVVYEPDRITTYTMEAPYASAQALGFTLPPGTWTTSAWEQRSVVENPLGTVLLIPLENNPDLDEGGISDLRPAYRLNDAANKFFMDMIHASEFISFPQRVLTGVELPTDPITGDVLPDAQVRAAASRLWAFEDPQARVFDLSIGSLANYVEGIDLAVQHIAAQTRTPPHYLLAKLANLSGDALKAAETGLVARVRRKMIDFSDSWEEAMRLAFAWRAIDRQGWAGADEDRARALMDDAETIWANPESRNPGTVGDELVKKQQIGVPQEILWEEAGYTPKQIKRMKQLRDEEQRKQMELMAAQAGQAPDDGPPLALTPGASSFKVAGLPAPPAPETAAANGGSNGSGQPG